MSDVTKNRHAYKFCHVQYHSISKMMTCEVAVFFVFFFSSLDSNGHVSDCHQFPFILTDVDSLFETCNVKVSRHLFFAGSSTSQLLIPVQAGSHDIVEKLLKGTRFKIYSSSPFIRPHFRCTDHEILKY